MGARRLVLFAVALALLAAPAAAEACSCLVVDPRSALTEADAAVVGVVESRVVSDEGRSDAPTAIRIRVERAVKGVDGPTVDVVSAASSASCPGQVVVADATQGTVDAIAIDSGFRNRLGRSADGVASLAVAPDGRHVAIVHGATTGGASTRFTVYGVWGSRTTDLHRELSTLPGGIAFAGDDRLVVLTPPNGGAHVLRPASGRAVGDLVGGFGTVCVATARAVFGVATGSDLRIGTLPAGPSRTVRIPGPVTEITALATTG